MAARNVSRKVAMWVIGDTLDGCCKADDGHKDYQNGKWRHSSPAIRWCQCRRSEGICVSDLREHDRGHF
jgi:hypothetical protein